MAKRSSVEQSLHPRRSALKITLSLTLMDPVIALGAKPSTNNLASRTRCTVHSDNDWYVGT